MTALVTVLTLSIVLDLGWKRIAKRRGGGGAPEVDHAVAMETPRKEAAGAR
jgi:hypothetical protein